MFSDLPAYPSTLGDGATWLATEPLTLREGVEIITGAGSRSMLVTPAGKFLSISPSGVGIVRRLGGVTGQDLIRRLAADHPEQAGRINAAIPGFLTDLRQAAVLTLDPEPRSREERVTGLGKIDPVKRLPIIRDPGRLAAPAARALTRIPAVLLAGALVMVPLAAVPLIVAALTRSGALPRHPGFGLTAAAMVVICCQIVLHEAGHAITMAYNDIRPRDAGLGLLFWFIPIAYVDRTETYRHRGRPGRVLISLVGPLSDLFWAGLSAMLLLSCTGRAATFFHLLLLLQLLSVLANLNPLFPSDGYHAVEAAVGSINMRGRALTYVLHKLFAAPLPAHLRKISKRVRAGYVCYVTLSLSYTLLVLAGVLLNLITLAGRIRA